jgi:hypothetical protein
MTIAECLASPEKLPRELFTVSPTDFGFWTATDPNGKVVHTKATCPTGNSLGGQVTVPKQPNRKAIFGKILDLLEVDDLPVEFICLKCETGGRTSLRFIDKEGLRHFLAGPNTPEIVKAKFKTTIVECALELCGSTSCTFVLEAPGVVRVISGPA